MNSSLQAVCKQNNSGLFNYNLQEIYKMENLIGLIVLFVLYVLSNLVSYRLGQMEATKRITNEHLAIFRTARKHLEQFKLLQESLK